MAHCSGASVANVTEYHAKKPGLARVSRSPPDTSVLLRTLHNAQAANGLVSARPLCSSLILDFYTALPDANECQVSGRKLLANSRLSLQLRLDGGLVALSREGKLPNLRSVAATLAGPESNSPTVSGRFSDRVFCALWTGPLRQALLAPRTPSWPAVAIPAEGGEATLMTADASRMQPQNCAMIWKRIRRGAPGVMLLLPSAVAM